MRYGYIFLGFKSEVFFWEMIVMTRKVLVIFVCDYFSSYSSEVQVLFAIFIMVSSVFSIIKIEPFNNATTNYNNIYSQVIQILFMYIGLFYITGYGEAYMDEDSVMNWILLLLNIVPTVIFFYRWIQLVMMHVACLFR